jgi:Icc protein
LRIERTNNQQPISVVQITDSHLGDQPGDDLLGMDTDHSLEQVLALICAERPQQELLLATGDISNCGSIASYRRFQQLTHGLAQQSLWLPGNHDTPASMKAALCPPLADGGQTDAAELSRNVQIGDWQILMLNSSAAGVVGGILSDTELAFLDKSLAESIATHSLICLHHHPIAIGCDWLDQQVVSNADAFFACLDRHPQVRGVIWGHVHQAIEQQRNGVHLLATPSTCVQFAANSPDFKLARLNPAYRWLALHSDGRIETGVSRVTAVEFVVDYEHSSGY